MTTDVETQAEAAIALLDPLCSRAKAIYCVKGTRYHEAPETTERLARELGAVRNPAGFYAAPTWAIEAGGLYIDTWHKLSDAQIYTAQSMQREAMFSRMMAEVKGYSADLILAGHWHSYRAYEDGKTTVLTTPCWELQTPWAEEGKPNLWLPGLGGLVIYLWPGNREKGLRPITWDRVLYPLPKREVSHLAIRGNKTKRESAGA